MNETLDLLLTERLGSSVQKPASASAPPSPRERIVQAALQLFAERSYEGATTKAIAQRAGVTERTLFKHFPSKEELFARTVFPALLEVMGPVTLEPIARVLKEHGGNFESTLRALVSERVTFAVDHPALMTMALREGLLRPPFRSAVIIFFNQRLRPSLEALIEGARASGQIADLPTDVVMRAIVGQMASYVATRVLLSPDTPWDDALEVERIVGLIMHGIAGTPLDAGTPPTGG